MPATGNRAGSAVLIGIGEYLRSEQIWPLRYAARDAEALAGLLTDPEVCGFPAKNVKLLTDHAASRDAVAHHLSKWLPEAARGAEIALVYFAGHGMIHRIGQRDEGYLLPHDADPEDMVTRGLLMTDLARWLEAIEARAVIVCLDCCHAAKVLTRGELPDAVVARDMRIKPALLQELIGRGRYLIASCDEGQVSLEAEDWGHGLFTHHLLEGIRGAGDRDGDGRIGIAELFEHVAEAVERDARALGVTQRPWSCAIGPGGVYLSTSQAKREQGKLRSGRSPAVLAIERVWHEQGADVAIGEIERMTDGADICEIGALLGLLAPMQHPSAIPLVFRFLAHSSEELRIRAKGILKSLGWERVTAFVETLAAQRDGQRMSAVLDGLGAFESHGEIVAMLDSLVTQLKGDLRNRAILLLERKQQALDLERIADLFRQTSSSCCIQKALGHGLSTASYLAHDESSDLDVVVRVLRPQLASMPQVRAQFLDLARRSVKLVHHNLVLTREVRAFPDRHIYYAMRDHVDGVALQKLLESGRAFDPLQIIKIIRQLLHGLTPVHSSGLLHGSVKPTKIFFCGEDRVVLGDLALPLRGVSLQLDRLSYDFRYAPPEMFQQQGSLGTWSDLNSLGCVAHELACGSPPFVSDNHFELAGMHVRGTVDPPSQRGSRLGQAGDSLILGLLAKAPSDRIGSVDLALDALDELYSALRPRAKKDAPSPPIVGDASLIRYATDAMMSVVSFTTDPRISEDTSIIEAEPDRTSLEARAPLVEEDETLATDLAARLHRSSIEKTPGLPLKIGRYEVDRLIGKGGLGSVYHGRDEALGRDVAIKLNRFASQTGPRELDRFRRESMAVARLDHPNIVSIYDVGEHEGVSYVVLSYVDGEDLREQLRGGPWSPECAARLMVILARAVAYAHAQGIVHRDLKPSNILLMKDGTPLISDFGLAKLIGEQQEEGALTMTGTIMGTPAYMSPEQAGGEIHKVGPAADIHALGVILYELLTGRRPFEGRTLMEMLMQLQSYEPQPPSRWRQGLSADLDAICLKCLAKQPEFRYVTAGELADDLERFLQGGPVTVQPQGLWQRIRRRLSFRKPGAAKDHPGR
jgi:serine/threonine protein kinase